MSNQVYANNMEVSCKSAAGKAICAFPDVCFTPPLTPATPPGVPIPYPNTGMASDCTDGSTSVMISGKEVMLKNKSYFKKSSGDEAGSTPKKGVVTSKITGKVYFNAWSMDVKVEGENVVRHLDLTTHNHGSVPGNTPTWPYMDEMDIVVWSACQKDMGKEHDACKDCAPRNPDGPDPCKTADASLVNGAKPRSAAGADAYSKQIMGSECSKTQRCMLQPFDKTKDGKPGCCEGQTGHHLVEASSFMIDRTGKNSTNPGILDKTSYDPAKAPCICVEGCNQYHGTHGIMHTFQSTAAIDTAAPGTLSFVRADGTNETQTFEKTTTYGEAKGQAIAAVGQAFPGQCDPKCLEAQLDAYHNQADISDSTPCKSVITGHTGDEWVQKARQKARDLMDTNTTANF
jgi:hypothetical protein